MVRKYKTKVEKYGVFWCVFVFWCGEWKRQRDLHMTRQLARDAAKKFH